MTVTLVLRGKIVSSNSKQSVFLSRFSFRQEKFVFLNIYKGFQEEPSKVEIH